MDKLLIEIETKEKETGCIIRVNEKANALVDDVAKKSGKSKTYIASKMIEYAFDRIEYIED